MDSTLKAFSVVALFALIALGAIFFRAPLDSFLVPHTIFYTVLLVNTFYSIRFWAAIQPQDSSQMLIDGILAVTYIALALSIGRPISFAIAALALFIAAPIKYMLMLGKIPRAALLGKKIAIDGAGTAICTLVLVLTLSGYGLVSAWIFAISFTLVNIYLLRINPMYRL